MSCGAPILFLHDTSVAVGVPAIASIVVVVGVPTVAGIHSVADLPSAADVCGVFIYLCCCAPDCCQYSGCEVLLLMLASLLNVAGVYTTAAAVIPDVNGVLLQASLLLLASLLF